MPVAGVWDKSKNLNREMDHAIYLGDTKILLVVVLVMMMVMMMMMMMVMVMMMIPSKLF